MDLSAPKASLLLLRKTHDTVEAFLSHRPTRSQLSRESQEAYVYLVEGETPGR